MAARTVGGIVLVATVLVARGVAQTSGPADTAAADVLLKVNGEAFTHADLTYRELWNYQQHVSTPLPLTIVNAVTGLVLAQYGRTLGYAMTDQLFQGLKVAQMQSNHLDSEEQWRAGIERLGVGPISEFRREKEREMIIQRVQGIEMIDKVPITDEEVLSYYRQRNGGSTATPAAQVLADIRRTAMTDTRQRAWEDFMRRLRSDATFEWPVPTVKRAYEEGLAQMTAASAR